jgi:cyclophilin family peptidyl-prolyl cis-trans isomerase
MLEYDRGALGMALSGKDTGGSQWFLTHSPQPHLDGGYTVFGKASEADMKTVDMIQRGDKIIRVKIIEDQKKLPIRSPARKKKRN